MNKIMTPEEIAENGKGVIDEIIRMSDFNFDRLPMLDIIGERLADALTAVLPDVTGVIVEASLNRSRMNGFRLSISSLEPGSGR